MPVLVLALAGSLPACLTSEEAFVGGRLPSLCDEAYWICNVTAGCILDNDHYIEGSFPGTHRVGGGADDVNAPLQARLFFTEMESPGTELLLQVSEPDCTLNADVARAHLHDMDLFEEAGDDRTLIFDLTVLDAGEHLVEVYSDASVGFLMVVEVLE